MSTLETTGTLTFEDFLDFPDDGYRHQLVAGVHVVGAAPGLPHQEVVAHVLARLFQSIREPGLGRVLCSPVALKLSDEDGVEPDVVVLMDSTGTPRRDRYIDGPPDLVVEVLSKSTRRLDLTLKRDRYARFGVGEYWVIDLAKPALLQFVRATDAEFATPVEHTERVAHARHPEIALDLGPVWQAARDAVS